jgi:spore coat protein CotH
LGYEFYREAGVPAIGTAFARVLLTIEGRFTNRVTGLYLLTEDPEADWAEETFGTPGVAVFKPVTSDLFKYLGEDWAAYERPYNAKTKVTPAQQQRLIALTRVCTEADDPEFNREIGGFVDLRALATWLACETTLANYDGLFTTGQNFLLYLDPRTDRFSFGPWDLDHSWGEFPFVGTAETREHASIWHPWTGANRFLERMLAHDEFRAAYRAELERLQATLFQPERLGRKLDELAGLIRPFVAEESTNRLARFEQCVADTWSDGARDGDPLDRIRPAYPLKRLFDARAKSVRAQLAGTETGVEWSGMLPP